MLDAGCGTGHLLLGVALTFPDGEFSGIDFSGSSIEVARALFAKYGKRATFQMGDYSRPMPFEGKFDVIILNGTIHCSPDPTRALKNVADYLAEDGIVYIMVYGKRSQQRRLEVKEMLHLLNPEDSQGRYAHYLDYLKKNRKTVRQWILALSLAEMIRLGRNAARNLRNRLKKDRTSSGFRSPSDLMS